MKTDVLIIGSGIAGLSLAIKLASEFPHRTITIVTKKEILESNLDKLHAMTDALVKYETIDETQIKDIMQGKAPKPPADWDDSVGTPPPKRAEGEAEGGTGAIGTPAGQH